MRRISIQRVLAGAALCVAAVLLAGCSTRSPGLVSFHELRLARSFKPIAIYWVGTSFDGIPLTSVDDGYDYDPAIGMRVYYGNCDKPGSLLHTGCKLPLQITSVIYVPHSNAGLTGARHTRIAGVPALVFDRGRSIELYSSYLAIDIVADTAQRARDAAHALEPLNEPPLPAGGLPRPYFRPGVGFDPVTASLSNALRTLPHTDTTLLKPGKRTANQ